MDVKASIIGMNFSVEPDIVLKICPVDGIPAPGILGNRKQIVLILGESSEIALSMGKATRLKLKGKHGSDESFINTSLDGKQVNLKGIYRGKLVDYFITLLESGYWVKGKMGDSLIDFRIQDVHTYFSVEGNIWQNISASYKMEFISDTNTIIRGTENNEPIIYNIFYTDEGIHIKGNQGPKYVDYTISSGGDRILVKGMTQNRFTEYSLILTEEDQLHLVGTPALVPVDYNLTLYDNGVRVQGNTGLYKSDYAFIT